MPFRDIIGHERPKAILRAAMLHDHVAHAYLFYGEDRIGKQLAAIRFAQAINCDTDYGPDSPDACGVCRSCHQTETRIHPDFLLIEPDREQANPQIKIEQIRELESQIIYKPLVGRRKICLIDEADRLTLGAANALLKTLEEPPAQSLFLLITSRPYALPVTVRSRCQGLRFATPARTQVEAALILKREIRPADAHFLAMVTQARIGQALQTDLEASRTQQDEFSALTAVKSLESITTLLTAAETLARADRAPEALDWIAQWIRDLVLVRIGADPDNLLNLDRLPALKETARRMPLDALLDLLDDIEAIQRGATRNLNLQMALETVLLRLRDAISVPAQPHSI